MHGFLNIKSGARIALVSNDDDNKVFHVAFRRRRQTARALHIFWNTGTLPGSEKFPVKDPFVELVKGSLNTFLNAMTYSDKTVYPVATCNDADFQNLMNVYLRRGISSDYIYQFKEIFMQEGCRAS